MRIKLIVSVFFIIWIVLIARIYFISIKSNTYYDELAVQNTIRTEKLTPVRGVVLDRNDKPLAVNKLGFSIRIKPRLSYKKYRHILEEEIDNIVSIFPKLKRESLLKIYKKLDSPYNHKYIKIVDFISHKDMLPFYSKLNLRKNIKITPSTKRYYPNRDIASHLIGYVSKANKNDMKTSETIRLTGIVGKSGIEKYYNSFLEGEAGHRKIKITAFNEEIDEIEKIPPVENNNIKLTIDLRLQKYIHSLFEDKSGVAIVMDARNGEILSAGSFPEFDINSFIGGISQREWTELITDLRHPFTNKLVNGLYPPGSVIKMGVGLSFLEHNIHESSTHYCSGEFKLGGRKFRCWKTWGHGSVDLIRAIRESCDDYFYKNSLKVGIENISTTLKQLGLGVKTGIDLPNEWIGVVPSKRWKLHKYNKPWYMGETLISSIGQGYSLVTPMQIARHTALIATDRLPTPHLIKIKGFEDLRFESKDVLTPFQKSKMYLLRKGMYQAANSGTGTATKYLRGLRVKVAGKTGTAQVVGIPQEERKRMKEEDMEYYRRSHAWLSVYAPAKKPKYIVTILVEHGGHGGESNGAIVKNIVNKLVDLGYLEPSAKR